MAENLQPGTVTTLGALRPGDVGETLMDPERFVVMRWNGNGSDIRTTSRLWENRFSTIPVRHLGRGRIESARIVMDGEPDPTIEQTIRRVLDAAVADGIATCARDPIRLTAGELVGPANILSTAMGEQQRRVAELESWKSQQLAVESEWDAQAVGRLLGVPLGQSIRAAIQPGIEKLQQRVAELEGHLRQLLLRMEGQS